MKTEVFCSGYGYRPHYTAKSDHQKRSHSKMFSRVGRFENNAFWKRCFLVWTEKTMLSEDGDVIKIDTTGRQTTPARVSKMADRRYHVPSILRQFRRLIYWNVHASSLFEYAHWGYKSGYGIVVWMAKMILKKCGCKSFWKPSKTNPFSFENRLVWTGP